MKVMNLSKELLTKDKFKHNLKGFTDMKRIYLRREEKKKEEAKTLAAKKP